MADKDSNSLIGLITDQRTSYSRDRAKRDITSQSSYEVGNGLPHFTKQETDGHTREINSPGSIINRSL